MEIEENCYNNVAQFFELFQATLKKSYYNLLSKITFNVLWADNSIKLSFNLVEKKMETNLTYYQVISMEKFPIFLRCASLRQLPWEDKETCRECFCSIN